MFCLRSILRLLSFPYIISHPSPFNVLLVHIFLPSVIYAFHLFTSITCALLSFPICSYFKFLDLDHFSRSFCFFRSHFDKIFVFFGFCLFDSINLKKKTTLARSRRAAARKYDKIKKKGGGSLKVR